MNCIPRRRAHLFTAAAAAVLLVSGAFLAAIDVGGPSASAQEKKQDREAKVREDRQRVETAGKWIYDDLPRGVAEATKSGKPLLVVLRCIPCEACAKLDEDVVDREPAVQALLDRFVCVRIPKTNGLDLSIFQFDTDQSWAAFFLNSDMTIYGRYGTRSHRTEAERDVTLQGFARSMEEALALHADFAQVKPSLAAKRGPPPEAPTPEQFETLKGRFTARLDWEGKVVPSCIHCHMIGEARRADLRNAGKPLPPAVLFPYPHPKILGLAMDPQQRARVAEVAPGSSAAADGFRVGDDIVALEGQPILSVADIQWVLHHAPASGSLHAEVLRGGERVAVPVTLAEGWRQRGDISWRVSSWGLRGMFTGGLVLEELPAEERAQRKLAADVTALRVTHVGQYGMHAAAKKAGFLKDDIVVAVDGATDLRTETELLTALAVRTKPGDVVTFTILRGDARSEMKLAMQ